MLASSSHTRLRRWGLSIEQPSDIEAELTLPDFSNISELIDNISQLSHIHLPSWHRGATISADVIFSIYAVICFTVMAIHWRRQAFWIIRKQQSHIVLNGFNSFVAVTVTFLLTWTAYSSIKLQGRYLPSVMCLVTLIIWLAGWAACWGSVYSIPSTPAFGERFSAKQMNCFFIVVPIVFVLHNAALGALHGVKYNEALQSSDAYLRVLRQQAGTAPPTQAQLDDAIKVWARFVTAFSYGTAWMLTCAAWSLLACGFYLVIFLRLMRELKHKKAEHLQSSSAAAQISPEWNEGTRIAARHFAALMHDSRNAKQFIPTFKPAASVAPAPLDVLFTKMFRNILLTGAFAFIPFSFLACISLFWALYPAKVVRSSDRLEQRDAFLIAEFLISASVAVAGAGMCAEAAMQSLQPVLGSWELDSIVSEDTKPRGLLASKLRQLTLMDRISRVPRATRSQIERVSRSFFETKSAPAQYNRRFSMPGAPRALAFPEIGEEDECSEAGSDVGREDSTSTHRTYNGLTASYGLERQLRRTLTPDSHHTLVHDESTRSMPPHQREAIELRIFPPPGERTRVYFIRETETTYETVPSTPPPRRPRAAHRPSWRATTDAPPRHA